MSKFENVQLFIEGNDYLREPQVEAYRKIKQFFNTTANERKEALIVLPTGTGKTGVMAIAPFAVSKKKALIITPQTVVANTVMGSLDSMDYKNFWFTSKTISDISNLPAVVHYNKDVTKGTLDLADIVVVNIHKLQERLESSLLRKVENDFFDFIIIDEAHHSEAHTWKKTVEYFKNAHVLKLTGTPFRSDGVIISGETIYSYPLSKAMANGYVKSLEKFNYIPERLFFTLDGDSKQYSLEELRSLKLKDNEWISRKVALSEESNLGVIKKSIEKLRTKQKLTNNPHKIVAVACSIEHATQLKTLYEKEGLEVAVVHSDMDKADLAAEFIRIDTHKVDVVINVALLGEGYDHKFLSIAAIFRPFRSDLPYQQFIGRVLRSLSPADTSNLIPEDNIAEVIVHEELGLDPLWEAYKKEIIKKGIITQIRNEKKLNPRGPNSEDESASIAESDEYTIKGDTFIHTQLLEERKIREAEEQKKIKTIMETLGVSTDEARNIVLSAKTKESIHLLRPDLAQANLRKEIDNKIREEIIPELLANNALDLKGKELYNMRNYIFPLWMNSLPKGILDNGGVLGYYFNTELRRKIGIGRKHWEIEDYHLALEHLDQMLPFVAQKIETYINKG